MHGRLLYKAAKVCMLKLLETGQTDAQCTHIPVFSCQFRNDRYFCDHG